MYFRMVPFFCIRISQGSVATCLKRGGIFKREFVANLLPSRLVKNFENRIIVSEVMAKSLVSCFFYSRCIYAIITVVNVVRSCSHRTQHNINSIFAKLFPKLFENIASLMLFQYLVSYRSGCN